MGPQGISYSVSSPLLFQDVKAGRSIHISRCLAHVINLATQALLGGHSPAKHYNPTKPMEHEPDVDRYLRDEIGLVRAIVVKVSSFCQMFVSLIIIFCS